MRYRCQHYGLEIIVDASWKNKTIDDFLQAYRISKLKKAHCLNNPLFLLNRNSITSLTTPLNKNDCITICHSKEPIDYLPARKPCSVVYEDDFVYVVHKESGILVHDKNDVTCLASQAATWQMEKGIQTPIRYIHRLDKETTGLVLFVKIPFFLSWYNAMLEEKRIVRKYYALTIGKGKEGMHFTYNQPIGKDRHVNGKYRISSSGKIAITKASILAKKDDILFWNCTLLTGRTHQIRVHLSSSHHPIINDPLYGIADSRFSHMALWAYQLEFSNPLAKEHIVVNDIPNPDFQTFLSVNQSM